jgi:nucleoside-diphosphate-sugar epimerase
MISRLTGATVMPTHEPARPGDIGRSQADISLATKLLGFRPTVPIEEGLARTVEWFRGVRLETRAPSSSEPR